MTKKIQFDLKDSYIPLLQPFILEGETLNQAAKRIFLRETIERSYPADLALHGAIADSDSTIADSDSTIADTIASLNARIEQLEQAQKLPDNQAILSLTEKCSYLINGGCSTKSDLEKAIAPLQLQVRQCESRIDKEVADFGKEIKRISAIAKKLGIIQPQIPEQEQSGEVEAAITPVEISNPQFLVPDPEQQPEIQEAITTPEPEKYLIASINQESGWIVFWGKDGWKMGSKLRPLDSAIRYSSFEKAISTAKRKASKYKHWNQPETIFIEKESFFLNKLDEMGLPKFIGAPKKSNF